MLTKKQLCEDIDESLIPMLKLVNIADFTKCIAQLSGLNILDVSDKVIKEYLHTWAKQKYRFFIKMKNKLKIDFDILYREEDKNIPEKFEELGKDFPAYYHWLRMFEFSNNNKIYQNSLSFSEKADILNLFNHCNIEGMSITHFFKNYLNAPDELITKLGRIWEYNLVQGTYTISIDPVDMMLASENPYKWTSCYRLETDKETHPDGCLAAILDSSSLITYIWNREGKFTLYDYYNFKNIRYYRMREWISIAPNNLAIHFNDIYPNKRYSNELGALIRKYVENFVNEDTVWKRNDKIGIQCDREYDYGYDELSNSYIYYDAKKISNPDFGYEWRIYDKPILCPCGCGAYLSGTEYNDGEYRYNGGGFNHESFEYTQYCEFIDDYCSCESCENCPEYNRNYAVCGLNQDCECPYADDIEDNGDFDPYESNVVSCGKYCKSCHIYQILNSVNKENKNR